MEYGIITEIGGGVAGVMITASSVLHCSKKKSGLDELDSTDSRDSDCSDQCSQTCQAANWMIGYPSVVPFVGTSVNLCHLLNETKSFCCLQVEKHDIDKPDQWPIPPVIIAVDNVSKALYNFIVPLRAHYIPVHNLVPIVLLLEKEPQEEFLRAIACFPLVAWKLGSMHNLDDLLKAGIHLCENMVVVNKDKIIGSDDDENLVDSTTIVTVQQISIMFPMLRIITELSHTSNMRFMQFNANSLCSLQQSKIESVREMDIESYMQHLQAELKRGSHMAYIFRLPFGGGKVFSASMLDTLLYQAFVKSYIIDFVRLLLGIDQAQGSGYLSSVTLKEDDLWVLTYGRLYRKLCSSNGDIPIGLYRTITTHGEQGHIDADSPISKRVFHETNKIGKIVKTRMNVLGLDEKNYSACNGTEGTVSFIIVNPNFDEILQVGDVVLRLKPCSTVSVQKSPDLATAAATAATENGNNLQKSNSYYHDDNPCV